MTFPDGACYQRPELLPLFYSDNHLEQEQAKAICWSCPVQLQCLAYAVEAKEKFGIWGGLLPAERKRIKL